jgi:hypothetical protein
MSFVRPELLQAAQRWREVIAGGVTFAAGLWFVSRPGFALPTIGVILIILGLGWAALAVRRLRFRQDGDAPGIVRVTEAQIGYLGPRVGGFIGLPDLSEIRLLSYRGRRVWKLRSAGGEALHIPVEAQGAEALFDAFAALPGMDTAALVAALGTEAPTDTKVVALDRADRVIWTRKGTGIVSR